MPTQTDIVKPLEQEIEEFHKLREKSRQLQERARWPEVKVPNEEQPSPDQVPALEVTLR